MGFNRKGWRAKVSGVGRLERGALSVPCKVLDISEDGVRLECRMLVKAGDALQLVIEHAQRSALTCGVEVVNVRSPRLGAKIVSINPENRERLAQILEDRVQAHFSRQ
jgi:hypothetical protein